MTGIRRADERRPSFIATRVDLGTRVKQQADRLEIARCGYIAEQWGSQSIGSVRIRSALQSLAEPGSSRLVIRAVKVCHSIASPNLKTLTKEEAYGLVRRRYRRVLVENADALFGSHEVLGGGPSGAAHLPYALRKLRGHFCPDNNSSSAISLCRTDEVVRKVDPR